jgi:hypothetical protein
MPSPRDLERFSLGYRAHVHGNRLPAKENYRLTPYIWSGTAIVPSPWIGEGLGGG